MVGFVLPDLKKSPPRTKIKRLMRHLLPAPSANFLVPPHGPHFDPAAQQPTTSNQ
jgi:hypothetical protein